MWSLSKNSVFVILRLDRGIQKVLKTLDSRFRENDDFLWKCQFLDKLCVPHYYYHQYVALKKLKQRHQ